MAPEARSVVSRLHAARTRSPTAAVARALLAVSALLLGSLVGCSREAAPDLSGEWRGVYTCDQGLAGLTLTFGSMIGDHLPATLAFYPLAGSADVPSGSLWMGGTFLGDARLVLSAGGWIEQPPGYELFDLDGVMSTDGRTYTGVVAGGSGCTSFFVTQVD